MGNQTLAVLEKGKFHYLENFQRDNSGLIPFDGTHGPHCIGTGEALLTALDNDSFKPLSNPIRTKVGVKIQCGANHEVPEGIYFSKVFDGVVYLEKYYQH